MHKVQRVTNLEVEHGRFWELSFSCCSWDRDGLERESPDSSAGYEYLFTPVNNRINIYPDTRYNEFPESVAFLFFKAF